MKVKAKLKGDVVNVKVLAKHVNAGPEEAEKKKIDANFITSVVAKCNDKVVYEMSGSGFVSKNPLYKFKFKGAKAGDKVEVTWTDLKGKTETKAKAIK
ncbi:MAG TPA: thiosulfate oxidation carrier complex protein SoxZ [Campylobacterales bacterium]|nr:thiosulfate oxidation carrier complex protein SoxZ [Campylobacterales bacterium]